MSDTRRRLVLVTGMSGAGKSSALKALEDLGYETVDNLPLSLLDTLLAASGGYARPLAVGIDIRTRDFAATPLLTEFGQLSGDESLDAHLLFLDCDDAALARRYSETRHRHPLAHERPLGDGIAHERRLLAPLRDRADLLVDTTDLSPHALKEVLAGHLAVDTPAGLAVFVLSFGFRRGLPREADLVLDVRWLRNPHYVPALKPLTGRDPAVGEYVAEDQGFAPFFDGLAGWLMPLLPRFREEGKSYLTIAIGCTGGRHRSVFTAERLAETLRGRDWPVSLRHRELDGV